MKAGATDTAPLYSPKVAEYFMRTPYAGVPEGGAKGLFSGAAGDRAHGTEVVFHMRVRDEAIAAVGYQVFGCPHTIAACALAAERLTGGPVGALMEMRPDSLAAELDAPVEKMGRILVVQDALRNCFVTWDNRRLGQR